MDTLARFFDVAQVLTTQPLAAWRRLALIGSSVALGGLAGDACAGKRARGRAAAGVDAGGAARR